ncbi:type I restriction enzyme, S subunit [Candidatus Magnetomoraceae bacterium gMMP-1]
MELRDGYKKTEVGVIPEDWEVKNLGEIGSFSKGIGIKKDQSNSGNIPCVRYGELYTRHNDFIKQFYSFISEEVSQTSKKLETGDILFAGSGETKEEIGKCSAFINDFEAYAGGDIVILSPFNISSLFLGFLLNSANIQKQKASRGQGDAVVHISASQLKQIKIPLPPLPEQKAIAEVLSDTDNLIQALEKRIAKKRLIKQGAMQKLLTPKDDWKIVKIKDITKFHKQGYYTQESYKSDGKYFLLRGTDMQNPLIDLSTAPKINVSDVDYESYKVIEGDFLFVRSGAIGRYGIAKEDLPNSIFGSYLINFTFTDVIDLEFFGYFYQSQSALRQLKSITQGGGNLNINAENIKALKIPIPPTKEEQKAIAEVLSDMDNEIEKLESKLAKYKMLKQGLMQNLLTGKIRLI